MHCYIIGEKAHIYLLSFLFFYLAGGRIISIVDLTKDDGEISAAELQTRNLNAFTSRRIDSFVQRYFTRCSVVYVVSIYGCLYIFVN